MDGLQAILTIALLLAVGAAAGAFGASAVARRARSRPRVPFLAGVVCGIFVGATLTARRRGFNAVGASALRSLLSPLRAGMGLPVVATGTRAVTGLLRQARVVR